jgi:hypothetical protein
MTNLGAEIALEEPHFFGAGDNEFLTFPYG